MEKKYTIEKGISVIIPTFNRASFLYPTLVCLLNQKIEQLLKYEVIIIDSGTDNSNEIVNLFKNKAPNLFVYKKVDNCSNRSLLRNIGAELAKYELLFFLDNDMLIPSTYLQERYNFHKNNRNLIVCGRRKTLIDFNMGKIGENLLNNNFSKLDLLPWYDGERLQQNINFESWRYKMPEKELNSFTSLDGDELFFY